jgi:chemotaxis protein methyltransferase CheR
LNPIGACSARPELRTLVSFRPFNLLTSAWPSSRPFDAIFCRNVMIYFDPRSRATLVHKLARQLAPGGFLIIGHSESLMGIRHDLETVRQSVFRKP